ncbi:hypothetical protein GCM10010169_23540 [Micromonospora fulviviridis]|nr:hypothetical protein GCM10010169_23540 [Micromonospora fulviviridis]
MCTATRPGGQHQAEPVDIRDNLFAVLRQRPGQPPRIALEHWDDPEAAEPAELILLDLVDAARVADVLPRLADLAGGTE